MVYLHTINSFATAFLVWFVKMSKTMFLIIFQSILMQNWVTTFKIMYTKHNYLSVKTGIKQDIELTLTLKGMTTDVCFNTVYLL